MARVRQPIVFLLLVTLASGRGLADEKASKKAEPKPGALLTAWLDATDGENRETAYRALKDLLTKGPRTLDLKAWARAHFKEAPPVPEKPKKIDSARALEKLEYVWTKVASEKRTAALLPLAHGAPKDFDLRAWTHKRMGTLYPLKSKELGTLLDETRWRQIMFGLTYRNPSAGVVKKAAKNDRFAAWCRKESGNRRKQARRAIMAWQYMFSGQPVPKNFNSKVFSRDLEIGTWIEVKDPETGKFRLGGLVLEGERLLADDFLPWAERQLTSALVMESVAAGKSLKPAALAKRVKAEHEKILAALKAKYG